MTRDIFRIAGQAVIIDYYARTTFKSLIAKPIEIDQINLQSEFQKKTVRRDFEKTLFADLKKSAFDYLIIDLIDERFDIIQVGDSFVTMSNELINAGLSGIGIKIAKSLDDWKSDCITVANRLLELVPLDKIIIHEAYWATQYLEDGMLKEYPSQKNINANNKQLGEYYAFLQQQIPAKIVKSNHRVGNSKHIWGLTPFHYTDDYYYEIYSQMISCP